MTVSLVSCAVCVQCISEYCCTPTQVLHPIRLCLEPEIAAVLPAVVVDTMHKLGYRV